MTDQTAGRCGNQLTTTITGVPLPSMICALPHGHDGWHRADSGAEWTRIDEHPAGAPIRVGDVFAAILDGRCPVGMVTAVDGHAFRLDLYSWAVRRFTAGTLIVRHDQVREFSPLAQQDGGGVYDMEPLRQFQLAWDATQ